MTVVAKLGSSIVADAAGDVRDDVLDQVCAQVAGLHAGGEDVVMVTSGAIALGMRTQERHDLVADVMSSPVATIGQHEGVFAATVRMRELVCGGSWSLTSWAGSPA